MADEISVPPVPPQTGANIPPAIAPSAPAATPSIVSPIDAVIRRATGQPAPVTDPNAATLPEIAPVVQTPPAPEGIDLPPGTEAETHGIDLPIGTEVEKPPSNLSEVQGQPFNPLTDFSVEGLVDAAKKDNAFDPITLLRSAPAELRNNFEVRQKVADAFVELWKYSEKHPLAGVTFSGLLKGAGAIIGGIGQWAYGHVGAASNALLGKITGDQGVKDYARTQAAQNILSLQLAGAQLGLQGEQLTKWVARHTLKTEVTDWAKPLADYTPEDKMNALNDAMAAKNIQESILTGETLKGADKLKVPLNPHAIEAEAAGNPFSLELMGRALGAPGKLVPAEAKAALASLNLGGKAATTTGKVLAAAGKAAETISKPIEKAAHFTEKTAVGEYVLAHLLGPPGVFAGKVIEKAGKALPKASEKLTSLGEQLATGEIKGDYAQLAKNAIESMPDTLTHVLSGGALDVGLAETTTQTPAEREGLGLGALLGAVGGTKGLAKRVIGGQLIGERAGAFTPEMTQRLHDVLGTGYQHKQFSTPEAAQSWFKAQGLPEDTSAQLSTGKVGGTVNIKGQDYTYAIGKTATPHEVVHAFKDSLPTDQQAKLDEATLKNYSPEEIKSAKEQYASQLDPEAFKAGVTPDEILSKATKGETPDQYIVNELQAENLMTYLKRAGADLKPKKSIPSVLAKGAAEIVSALGGEPLETERSQAEALKFPLKYKEVKGLVKAAKEKITPESKAAAEELAKHRTTAEDVVALGEEHPDKADVLRTLGEAQDKKGGVKLTYSGATGEQPSDLSSDLPGIDADARRAVVEAEREAPPEARTPWWKTFFPDRTFETKGGKLQSGGWLPAIFTANAYRFAKSAAATPEIRALSPYEVNPQTNFFTPEAYDQLQKDVQVAVKNWKDGRTASGTPLQVPENVKQQSGGQIFQPPVGPGGGALDTAKADFISHLMGHKLPSTARLTKGVFPLNVAGQDVSAATMPGRVEAPRAVGSERGVFGEAAKTEKGLVTQRELAKESGVEGRQLLEVNPFRLKLEAAAKKAGVEAPKPVSAYQRLNLERVLHAEHAPAGEPELRGNTLTQAAGFEPRNTRDFSKFEPAKHDDAVEIAKAYAKDAGIDYNPPKDYKPYNRELGKKLAAEYENAYHDPEDPDVRKSYDAFKKETLAQWKAIKDAGYDLEPVSSAESPYVHGADVARDLNENKHMVFNLSESAFGVPGQSENQLMLEPSGETSHGKELSFNDIFRAVHDFFGHGAKGLSFGPRGEFNAWREHSALYSPEAQGALAAETIGQTAWTQLNPSLLSKTGEILKPGDEGFVPRPQRPYATQKNFVMPESLINEAKSSSTRFEPSTDSGKEMEKKGFTFKLQDHGTGSISLSMIAPDGTEAANLDAIQSGPKYAQVEMAITKPGFQKQGLGEALYRELGSHLQKKGVKVLGGLTVSDTPRKIRERVFGAPLREIQMDKGVNYDMRKTYSPVSPSAKFEPADSAGAAPEDVQKARKAWKELGVESPYFKHWFEGSKVVTPSGAPKVVYHGTTHEFEQFDLKGANIENYWGPGHYFTTSEYDASNNYAGEGADLLNRIEKRTEELQRVEEAAVGREPKTWDESYDEAYNELRGPAEDVIPAYLKIEKPVVFSRRDGAGGTWFEYSYDEDTGKESGTAIDFLEALKKVSDEYDVDHQTLWEKITEDGPDFSAQHASDVIRQNYDAIPEHPETGEYQTGVFIQKLFREMGFDGIVQKDADRQFQGLDMDPGTDHYVVFNPEQVKGKENVGTFKRSDPRFRHEPKTFVVRHGSTELNSTDKSKDKIRGWLNVPLDSRGRKEAEAAGEQLKGTGLQHIYSSDLDRTIETAQAIQKKTGAPITATAAFRPWHLGPTIEGKSTAEVLPKIEEYIKNPDTRPPGGESLNEFKDRFLNKFHEVQTKHPNEHTAIVTHYRGTKLLEAWRDTGVDNDSINPEVLAAYSKDKKPGNIEALDKKGNLADHDPMKEMVESAISEAAATPRAEPKKQDRKKLSQVVGPKKIELVHLSSNPSLKEVDPSFFGKGKATPTDRRGANKSYWFVKGSPLSSDKNIFGLGGHNQYSATISGDKIYDLSADKPDPMKYLSTINREEADTNLKDAGYRGLLIDTADGRKVVVLYDKQPVKSIGQFKGTRAQPSINSKEVAKDIFRTLTPGEGFTYSPFNREHRKTGYAVSIYPERSDVIDAKDLTQERVEKFVENNKDLLTRAENSVGGWYDPESKKVYLDVSFTTPSRELAEFAGKEYNQKAIGDLAKYAAKEPGDIPTGGTGEALPDMMPEHKRADELLKDFDWEQPSGEASTAEQTLMPGLGSRAPLSSKDIGEMTKAELGRHFPEAVLTKRRHDLVDNDIVNSPLAKQAGSREAAVTAYADRLENFAKERIHTPEFKDGTQEFNLVSPR